MMQKQDYWKSMISQGTKNGQGKERTREQERGKKSILQYRADYNNRPTYAISFMTAVTSTSDRLHCDLVQLLFLQDHRETDRVFADSGVQIE